jgi:ABC-type transport system substrate-binding protein
MDIMGDKVQWWDKLGKPQYGGEMTIRANRNIVNFDPYFTEGLTSIYGAWMEKMVADDWTVDPSVWNYKIAWHPIQYLKGNMAESWEFPDCCTHVVHLRKGIHWQKIPPANGREFTADDVVFHFNRMHGMGGGYNQPCPSRDRIQDLISVTATDNYTVTFKFKALAPEVMIESIHDISQGSCLENPDAVKKWGDVNDWHHAIGTGPFILQDFVAEKSATLVKNPDYWGHDERYPQNKLPYLDKLKYLVILDDASAAATMCAGELDVIPSISAKQAQSIRDRNPEILQIPTSGGPAITIQLRNDKVPFNDIRVRKALQLAIDLPAIAKIHYGGTTSADPSSLCSSEMGVEWGGVYQTWPQDVKDQYAYNPTEAKKLLSNAGYPNGFRTNVIADTAGDMVLLQIIKTYFAAVGIDMEIRPMPTSVWLDFVVKNNKHDQMVYRPYGPLGHTKAPLRIITNFYTGLSKNFNMVSDPVFDAYYPKAKGATSLDHLKEILKEANEYVAQQHFVVSLLHPVQYALCQPWVKGYNAQVHSVWMGSGGPSLLGFYGARFWIDQNLKKSKGL